MPDNAQSNHQAKVGISSSVWWMFLALLLYVVTFGVVGTFFSIIYLVLFFAGFIAVIGWECVARSEEMMSSDDVQLLSYEDPYCGIPAVFRSIETAPQGYKYDKRMTGSSCIDEVLQDILQYFFRDYIHSWYKEISDDERFVYLTRQTIQHAIITFASRSKEVEWVNFLTTRLVDIFATHLRIFRITKERLEQKQNNGNGGLSPEEERVQQEIDLETMFFSVELEVDGVTRQSVCLDDELEQKYLQDVAEILFYLLFPQDTFNDKVVRSALVEICATSALLPTVNMLCDPDYVNQHISWWCDKDTTFTVEAFLTTIRHCQDVQDLEETKKKVDFEIAKLRSQDSQILESNESELSVKKQLNSLMYVRKLCVTTIRHLKSGKAEEMLATEEGDSEVLEMLRPNQNIPRMPLKDILDDNTALSYFIEYMGGFNAEHYVFFYLTIEGFRATAIQQLCMLAEETAKAHKNKKATPTSESFEQLKQAAANIYDDYLSPKASPRIVLEDQLVRKIVKDIKSNEPSGAYFDNAHIAVYKILESSKYYGSFLNSTAYLKCLVDLDMLHKSEDDQSTISGERDRSSTISSNCSRSFVEDRQKSFPEEQAWTPDLDLRFSALIGQANNVGIGNKTHTVYTIHVCRTTSDGSRNWQVARRYSDFHDFHMQLREKFEKLHWLQLPGKKTFGNMGPEFIEKRKNSLENYIQPLLETSLLSENAGLFELVAGFLEEGEYYPGKSPIARKMDHIVNPIQNSISNVSKAVKLPDFNLNKTTSNNKSVDLNVGKLSDALDSEVLENIPLRILLLLVDEVFDLRERNQWLRRRIVVVLRQIIKATFGDRINRKIVDYVDFATNSQQIAEYLRQFRDSYWPGGVLSEPAPDRDEATRRRMRMVTKTKMLGSIPDELRRFLGSEVVRDGSGRVFDMCQHLNLNKRLFYVIFEALLEEIFVDNKFPDVFKKIHETNKRKSGK